MHDQPRYPPAHLSWLIWALGATFYLSGFYQRVAPAVMTDQLMAGFGIGATELGNLSAFYFYSYVAMQIPTGILADYWGPRKLLTTGAFIAALGAFLFALAPSILMAKLGRLLIGGSVGVAWVTLLKLSMHWFPPHRFAMTNGLALLCGLVGAVSAGVPLRILVENFGWRPVMFFSAVGALLIAIALGIVVRDDPSSRGYVGFSSVEKHQGFSFHALFSSLKTVAGFKNTWLLSLAPSGVAGPILAFSGLWGVPFFSTHYGLSPAQSAALTSTLLVAWGLGGPVLGALSDGIGRRKALYVAGCITSSCGWTVILFVPKLPVLFLTFLVLLVGFASGSMVLGFAFIRESVPPMFSGTASGICNMGVMTGPMVLQPVMGWIMDKSWDGMLENGTRIYPMGAYQSAFALMLGWSIVAAVLICFTTETHCRQMVE
ncbi:MAG: MFS transporter [Thermodesulfobacteriota bacterium]